MLPWFVLLHVAGTHVTLIWAASRCRYTRDSDLCCFTLPVHTWLWFALLHVADTHMTVIWAASGCRYTRDRDLSCFTLPVHTWSWFEVSSRCLWYACDRDLSWDTQQAVAVTCLTAHWVTCFHPRTSCSPTLTAAECIHLNHCSSNKNVYVCMCKAIRRSLIDCMWSLWTWSPNSQSNEFVNV